ncbi:MAG: TIGR04282 family arsenosugar biosynthesis glycosyltransferase [Thermodesulfobacteriota bacterium]|nr:TIGR04282 family arsenosugar biosynthesis glycosyltransferase [Thermodesulfobacteriota bacterium]
MTDTSTPTTATLLFVKAPVSGQVKTRLAATLGDDTALNLYQCFVADMLDKLESIHYLPRIYFHPPDAGPDVRTWLGDRYAFYEQKGRTLGDKMSNALAETFDSGIERAVLMGTDFPDLPSSIITEALTALDTAPAVIGPSTDGGYYLIGFTADGFTANVFDDIPWSTDTVFTRTCERFQSSGIGPYILPQWLDIDTEADLRQFAAGCRDNPGRAPHTMQYLTNKEMP